MDKSTLVESQVRDGQKLVEQLAQLGFPMTAAFWLKIDPDSRWKLHIASPAVRSEGSRKAYIRVNRVIRQMPPPFAVEPLDMQLDEPKDPFAVDVRTIQQRYPDHGPISHGGLLGGVGIEGALIYPLPVTAATS